MTLSTLDKLNINIAIRAPLLSYDLSLKPFSVGISEISKLLLTIFRVSLRETLNTN